MTKNAQFDVSQVDCTSMPVSNALENLMVMLRTSPTPAEAIAILQQALTQTSDHLVPARICRALRALTSYQCRDVTCNVSTKRLVTPDSSPLFFVIIGNL